MISEKILVVMSHYQFYQKRMANTYNRKVYFRVFEEGDLVLKNIISLLREDQSKWASNYKGSFMVKKAFLGVTQMLTRMDGTYFPRFINFDSIKKYYV